MNISKNNEVKKNTFVWGGGRGLSDKIHLSPPKFLPKYATANGGQSTSEKSGGLDVTPSPRSAFGWRGAQKIWPKITPIECTKYVYFSIAKTAGVKRHNAIRVPPHLSLRIWTT